MLTIVTALSCEARPLVDYFKLKATLSDSPFPIYQREKVTLIVSGVGKVNAALAVGYIQAKLNLESGVWLNVGIAGHQTLAVGTPLLAHKVIDSGTGRAYYPTFLKSASVKTDTIYTVEHPEKSFGEKHVYEMEAAGFMQAALRFSSSELVHCYKIISDNLESTAFLAAKEVQALLTEHCREIQQFADTLQIFREKIFEATTPSEEPFLSQWHFTNTQRHQLRRLLNRWASLESQPFSIESVSHLANTSDLLYHLEQEINALPFRF